MNNKPENLSKYFNKKIKKRRYKLKYKNLFGGALSDTFNIDPDHDYLYHGTSMFYFDEIKKNGMTGRYPDTLYQKMKEVWELYESQGSFIDDGRYIGNFFDRQDSLRKPNKEGELPDIQISFTKRKSVAKEYAGNGRTGGEGPGRFLYKLRDFIARQNKTRTVSEKEKKLLEEVYNELSDIHIYPGMILFVKESDISNLYISESRVLETIRDDEWEAVIRVAIPPEKIYIVFGNKLMEINSSKVTEIIEEEKVEVREKKESIEKRRVEVEEEKKDLEHQKKTAEWKEKQEYLGLSDKPEAVTYEIRKFNKIIEVSYYCGTDGNNITITLSFLKTTDDIVVSYSFNTKFNFNTNTDDFEIIKNTGLSDYIIDELDKDLDFKEKVITGIHRIISELKKRHPDKHDKLILFINEITNNKLNISKGYIKEGKILIGIDMGRIDHTKLDSTIVSKYICEEKDMSFNGCQPFTTQRFRKVIFCGDNTCNLIIGVIKKYQKGQIVDYHTRLSLVFFPSQFDFDLLNQRYPQLLLSGNKDIRKVQYKYLLENLIFGQGSQTPIPLSKFLLNFIKTNIFTGKAKMHAFISIFQFYRSADLGIDKINLREALLNINKPMPLDFIYPETITSELESHSVTDREQQILEKKLDEKYNKDINFFKKPYEEWYKR